MKFILEEADEQEWTVDEANEKFQASSEENCWRTAFNQGVNVDEKIFDDYTCEKSSEEYIARHDLTFLTPCAHELRCKVSLSKCFFFSAEGVVWRMFKHCTTTYVKQLDDLFFFLSFFFFFFSCAKIFRDAF